MRLRGANFASGLAIVYRASSRRQLYDLRTWSWYGLLMLHRVFSMEAGSFQAYMSPNEEWKAPALYVYAALLPFAVRSRLSDLFGNGSLDWLVGVTSETDPHLAELRHFGNVGVVSLLGILRLDFERLLSRLGSYQLLKCAGRVLKRHLGVIGNLGGNSLKALVRLTIGADDRIEAFLLTF